jgi:hypothetical protein
MITANKEREWGSVMTNMSAEMAKNTAQENGAPTLSGVNSAKNSALAQRYRQIGISAVLAATRYHGAAKNPAYAPAPIKWDDRAEGAAA